MDLDTKRGEAIKMQRVPEQIGRYQIVGIIGKGGMGIVLKGYDAILQRHVAIKLLHPHLAQDSNTVARFLAEAKAAASLQHPNIIAIYEAGEDKGLYYFVMEFMEGKDLATLLRERGRFSFEEALPILEQIASAIDYAHQKGIIHRDIKASNIMVTKEGLVKVMDFGIARVLGGERFTQTGVLVGTPEYMAPELWEGKEASKASDIYAFGILAYEMLSGEVPFTGTTPVAVGYKHVHEEVPVERLRGLVEEGVIEAIRVGMAKVAEERFKSATEFVRAMKEGRKAMPRVVSPPSAAISSSISSSSSSVATSSRSGFEGAVSLPTPETVPVRKLRWLLWISVCCIVLGLIVVLVGGSRWLREYRLEQAIYEALEEGRLISPPNNNALELYRTLRKEFPNGAAFQRVRTRVLHTLREEINTHFDNFYRIPGEKVKKWKEIKKLCDWAVEIAPYDNQLKAQQKYCYGRLEFWAKHYENAIQFYKEAIQNDPNWALPYNSVGVVYAQKGNWMKVLEWCSKAKKLDENWVAPYLNMGWAYHNLKRYDEAEQEYQRAIELDPNRPTPYCRLSCLYEKQGWFWDALEMALKAKEIIEQNPEQWGGLMKDLQTRIERLQQNIESLETETEQYEY